MKIRIIGLIALIITLFASLFHIYGAELSNNVVAVAVMILLLILFTDLKEFNFWGLTGKKKDEEELKALKGKDAITEKNAPKATSEEVQKAAKQETVQVEEDIRPTFLALAFEIERLLRIACSVFIGATRSQTISYEKLLAELRVKNFLTADGEKQAVAIRDLRDILIYGKENNVNDSTIEAGIDLAWDFYRELKDWVENPE